MPKTSTLLLSASLLIATTEGGLSQYIPGKVCRDVYPSDFLPPFMGRIASTVLAGKHLRIIELHWPPFAIHNASIPGNAGWTGMDVDILEVIARRLKFTYDFVPMSQEANETWTDTLLRYLPQGDLIGTYWLKTKERSDVAFMHKGHVDGSVVLVKPPAKMRQMPFMERLFTFTQPFSFTTWVAIVLTACVSGLGYYLLEGLHQGDDTPIESIYEAFNVLVYGENAGPSSSFGRLHAPIWGFVSLVLLSTYTANLTQFMTMRAVRHDRISSVQDVISKDIATCLYESEPLQNSILRQFPGIRWTLTESYGTSGDKMMSGSGCEAMVLPRVEHQFLEAKSTMCGMQIVGPPLVPSEAGWVSNVPSYCVGLAIQNEVQDLYLQGRIGELMNQYLALPACENKVAEIEGENEKVQIGDIGGLLLLYIVGLAGLVLIKVLMAHLQRYRAVSRASELLPGQRQARRVSHAIQRCCFREDPVRVEDQVTLDRIFWEIQLMRTEVQALQKQVNGKVPHDAEVHSDVASERDAVANGVAVTPRGNFLEAQS